MNANVTMDIEIVQDIALGGKIGAWQAEHERVCELVLGLNEIV